MGRAVSQSSSCLSVSLLRCVSRGTLASTVAEQLVIYISGKDVAKHLSIIMQLQLKALANVPPHWERTASLIWFSRRCVSPCVCRSQRRPISRMWSTEMAVVGRQQRRNSWCGHNWVTGSVCNLHTSALLSLPPHPPTSSLSVSILSGGEMAFVMVRGWQLSATSVSMPLSQPSPLGQSTCPSLAQLQRSSSAAAAPPVFVLYSTGKCAFDVIVAVIWTELKCGSVWLILMHLRWIPLPA